MSDYFERCESLFGKYPLAVDDVGPGTITLMRTGGPPRFYGLGRCGPGAYQIWQWNGSSDSDQRIEPGTAEISREFSEALGHGVPLPRDGAMFGYCRNGGDVDALITVHQNQGPVPEFAVLVRTDSKGTEDSLPSFAGQPFGEWFWLDMQAGYIFDLAAAVSVTRSTVFWVPRVMLDDTGVIVVRTPVALGRERGDRNLPAGIYALWRTVRVEFSGLVLADEVLARPGAVDLGPRFRTGDDG